MTMCNKCHYDPCQCDYFDELVYTAADLAIDIDIILKSDQSWPDKVRNIRMACWAARHPNQDPFAAFAKYFAAAVMTPTELKEARHKLGLTQAQLADQLGVIRITVVRWENGSRAIPKLAQVAIEMMEKRK